MFQAHKYRQAGQVKPASLDQFLASTGTTSFIVARDGPVLAARIYFSDYNPLLLGLILERTTHRPTAEYLQDKIG